MKSKEAIQQAAREAAQTYFDNITEPVLQNPARYEGYKDGFIAGAEWMQAQVAAPQTFSLNDCVVVLDPKVPDAHGNYPTRTGRIHYGGYAQHVIHYVIAEDTRELIKVSEASRKIAADRLVEKQRQMKKEGYTGPFGLPHHCFTHGQTVSFTVDEAGEAVIIF